MSAAWMARAACVARPDLPWTTDTHCVPGVVVAMMADTCRACPVLASCRDTVSDLDVTGGFWAGQDRALPDPTNPADTSAHDVASEAGFDWACLGGVA